MLARCRWERLAPPPGRERPASPPGKDQTGLPSRRPSCAPAGREPYRSGKAATIEQDDAVVLGQPEHDVERMHVLLHPLHDVLAQVLAGKELEVDQAVVVVEVLVRSYLDVQTLDRRLDAFLTDT